MKYRINIVCIFLACLTQNVFCQENVDKVEGASALSAASTADTTTTLANPEVEPSAGTTPDAERVSEGTVTAEAETTETETETETETAVSGTTETIAASAPETISNTGTTSSADTTASSGEGTDRGDRDNPYLTVFEKLYYRFIDGDFPKFIKSNHWGAFGGVGPANVHFEQYDMFHHCVCNVRFGIVADHDLDMIKENLFVEAGLEFQRKGYQRFFDEHAEYLHEEYKEKTNLFYLVIPTTASYRFHFRGFEFTPMVGPYYAIAVGGRYDQKRETIDNGQYIEQSKSYGMFGDKTGTERLYDTRRFDFGLRLAVGIQYFEKMRSSMGYDWGFVNIIKADFRGDKYKSKNGVFYISHTYFFK